MGGKTMSNQLLMRRRMMKTLPYDSRVEYLESSGTQYINPDIFVQNGTRIVCEIQGLGDRGVVFSFYQDYVETGLFDNGSVFYMSGLTFSTSNQNSLDRKIADIRWEGDSLNFQQIGTIGNQSNTPQTYNRSYNYIYLFKGYGWNASNSYWNGRIYWIDVYKGSNKIASFIPVRVGSIGYLYNKITGDLLSNAGTGDFIVGRDI